MIDFEQLRVKLASAEVALVAGYNRPENLPENAARALQYIRDALNMIVKEPMKIQVSHKALTDIPVIQVSHSEIKRLRVPCVHLGEGIVFHDIDKPSSGLVVEFYCPVTKARAVVAWPQ